MNETLTHHFTITGEFITQRARDLASEGKPGQAWQFIRSSVQGLSLEQAAQILSGHSKIIGVNNDINLVDDDTSIDPGDFLERMLMEGDAARPFQAALANYRDLAGLCHQAYHPLVKGRYGISCRGTPAGLVDEKVVDQVIAKSDFANILMKVFPRFSSKEWDAFWDDETTHWLSGIVRSVHKWCNREVITPKATEKPEPAPRPIPKTGDITREDNGWLLPDGKFYPCSYMGHGQLACDLKVQDDRAAEDLGWIRIGLSQFDASRHIRRGRKDPTQAQINKIDLFCEATGMELPYWLRSKGEHDDIL